jgi:hypothetical protein
VEIQDGEFQLSSSKLDAILNLPPPTNRKMLESQFALLQYYKKFIPEFAELMAPFKHLLSSKSEYSWTDDCEKSRKRMLNMFATNIALHLPDHSKAFRLATDASSYAAAATLSQKDDTGEYVPVAFYSKAFNETQLKYSILDKELFAMVSAIKHFEFYLMGKHFDLITDSKCLFYLKHAKDSNPKLYRWSLLLQSFDFTLTHVSTKQNLIPDVLSRQNEVLQKESRIIHEAKKQIMDKIRSRVSKMNIPENAVLSSSKVTNMLSEKSNLDKEDKILESINHVTADLEDPSVLSAISIQPGALPIETLIKLQQEDQLCKELKQALPSHFAIKKGVLIRIRNESHTALVTPQLVLPEILVDMVIALEHSKTSMKESRNMFTNAFHVS